MRTSLIRGARRRILVSVALAGALTTLGLAGCGAVTSKCRRSRVAALRTPRPPPRRPRRPPQH